MPNPGTFKGTRLVFLDSQADVYAEGVRNNQLADVVADIQRRYLKRYPMSLEHNVEPTQEWLASVDDSAPDPELLPPNLESLSNDAYAKSLEDYNKLSAETKARKDSIKRRLAYVYSKNCGKDASFDVKGKKGASDPLSTLKAKLAGVELKTPRMRTAYNVWGPQNRSIVDPIYIKRVQEGNVPAKEQLALRSAVYKELFEELPDNEQKKWAEIAKRDHDQALEDLKVQERNSAVHSNTDYQRVISALPAIVQPILDLLCEYTGWKFSMQGGGPEPADGGRLNMIFMHSGIAPGSVSVDFGGAERETFKKLLMPAFGRYMKRCYNKEACISRALPANHGTATLEDVRSEEGINLALYRVEYDKSAPKKRLFEQELDLLNKGKGKAKPPTGTPSPMVRFGPPIGKKKNRMLPTKDDPASLLPGPSKVFKSSPLAQAVFTAHDLAPELTSQPSLDTSMPQPAPSSSDHSMAEPTPSSQHGSAASVHTGSGQVPASSPENNLTMGSTGNDAMAQGRDSSTMQLEFNIQVSSNASGDHDAPTSPSPADVTNLRLGSDGAPSLPPSPVPSRPTSPVDSILPTTSPSSSPVASNSTLLPAPLSAPFVLSSPTPPAPSRPTSPISSYVASLAPLHPTSTPLYQISPLALGPTSPSSSPSLSTRSTLPCFTPPTPLHTTPTASPSISPQAQAQRPISSDQLCPITPAQPPRASLTPSYLVSAAESHLPSPCPSHRDLTSPIPLGAMASVPTTPCPASPVPTYSDLLAFSRSSSSFQSHPTSSALSSSTSLLRPTLPLESRPISPPASRPVSPPASHFTALVSSCSTMLAPSGSVSPIFTCSSPSAPLRATSPTPVQPTDSAVAALLCSTGTASTSLHTMPHKPPSSTSPGPQRTLQTTPLLLHMASNESAPSTGPPPTLPRVINGLETTGLNPTPPGAATVPTISNATPMSGSPVIQTASSRQTNKRASPELENSQPSKKQRTGVSIARAFAVPAATDCPKWASNAVDFLAGDDLGIAWRRLVALWVSVEAGYGFDEQGTRLLARGWPAVVSDWIKRARSPKYRPDISNLANFENVYVSWWRSIQPDWRLSDTSPLLNRADGDWDVIRCSGVNGLLSALAALFFWGVALGNERAANPAWNTAVNDAIYVLESIM